MPFDSAFLRHILIWCLVAVTLFLIAGTARAEGRWEGTWQTTYGEVRLRQDGRRVWGDYANQRGVIEGRTTPDGGTFRGTFLREDDRWGWIFFTFEGEGEGWRGAWRYNDIAQPGDTGWNASSRSDAGQPELVFASGPGPFWPPTYAGAPFGRHAAWVFGPDERDPYEAGQVQASVGGWHGLHDSDTPPPGYAVSVAIDEEVTPGAALVELAFFAPQGAAAGAAALCPKGLDGAFCAELHQRFGPDVATRDSMAVEVIGTQVAGDRVLVAFLLTGDAAPRLLELRREGGGLQMRVWHPARGLDLDAAVVSSDHPCDGMGTCDPSRGLQGLPGPGQLLKPGFVEGYTGLPDGQSQAAAAGPVRLDGGFYEMRGADDMFLGELTLEQRLDGAVTGTGVMRDRSDPAPRQVQVATVEAGAERLMLDLAGAGQMTIAPAGEGLWTGTLGGDPVVLTAIDEFFDLPGIGVTGPSYRLRNTGGNAALLRTAPRSDASGAGRLTADMDRILVLRCRPEIDTLAWEGWAPAARVQALEATWCEVRHDSDFPGWIPGFFLEPVAQ